MKQRSRIKYDSDRLLRIRKQGAFDFLTVNRNDLMPDQWEIVRVLYKHDKEDRGLTEAELQTLFNLVDSLKPDNELIIRSNS